MKPKTFLISFIVLASIVLSNIPAHSSNKEKLQNYQVHTVKAGDSLSKIAYEYYGDYTQMDRIANFNDIKDIDKIKIGQKVKIPFLSTEQSRKTSRVNAEDLDASKQSGAAVFKEKSLTNEQIFTRLDRPAVFFIIVYLLVLLFLLLVKWLGLRDNHHIPESENYVRPHFTMVNGKNRDP